MEDCPAKILELRQEAQESPFMTRWYTYVEVGWAEMLSLESCMCMLLNQSETKVRQFRVREEKIPLLVLT